MRKEDPHEKCSTISRVEVPKGKGGSELRTSVPFSLLHVAMQREQLSHVPDVIPTTLPLKL